MQTKHLFLLPALAFLACAGLQAQVRIGGDTAPTVGAVLDLNSPTGNKGGLLLSNVSLTDLNTIPAEIYEAATINGDDAKKAAFKGAIVYNTNPDTGMGVYVWTGTQWIPAGTSILYDAEGNDYTVGDFGAAGIWMTQNLRTKGQTYNGAALVDMEPNKGTGSTTEPQFSYPRVNSTLSAIGGWDGPYIDTLFKSHVHYGLLYNWAAASGRTDNPATSDATGVGATPGTTHYRGVCPENWHLPNDNEWIQLEQEIATSPQKYSSQDTPYEPGVGDNDYYGMNAWRPREGTNETYWGRQMKSRTPVNGQLQLPYGTSNKREEGGFDVLLVGSVYAAGTVDSYGLYATFWSSSSSGSNSIHRGFGSVQAGVDRTIYARDFMFGVRCKKD
jgi:uncharacterized protein (TIGR02145 family)